MARPFSFASQAAVAVAACLLAASMLVVARAGEKAQLTGHWNFNPNLSDDAGQKVRDAQQSGHHGADSVGRSYPGTGASYPGSAGPPGGGVDEPVPGGGISGGEDSRHGIQGGEAGSPVGGAGGGVNYPGGTGREPGSAGGHGPEGVGNHGSGGGRGVWDRLSQNPKFLQIEQHAKEIVISDDTGHSQTYYADGKKHEEKDASGKKISTKAVWEGKSLVAETRLSPSEKLTESFRLSEDGSQLYVKTRFETSALEEPISIRRVYELGKAPTK
jgi:hypothetical protein